MAVLAILLLPCSGRAWVPVVEVSQGYTHYEAEDLNRIIFLLEETTRKMGGFNPYTVNGFYGHPAQGAFLGAEHRGWRLGLEAEFWVEDFRQDEVPFDGGELDRATRISCADLRAQPLKQDLYGCLTAREMFRFLPIMFHVGWDGQPKPWLRLGAGYGAGVLAGDAYIRIQSEYLGEGAAAPDDLKLIIHPGVNPVQKLYLRSEWSPWPFLGLGLKGGWRVSRLKEVGVKRREGSSRIFDTVFPDAVPGAKLYIRSYSDNPDDDEIYIGTEASARQAAADSRTSFKQVKGDFDGWFAALSLVFRWRGI